MKKINKIITAALLASALLFSFTACNNAADSKDDGDGYAVQPKHSNSCGAYAAAYYLTDTNQIKKADIKKTADEIYKNVQFGESGKAIPFDEDTLDISAYSDPVKLRDYLNTNNLAASATLKMISDEDAQTYAEGMIIKLKKALNITVPDTDRIASFEDGMKDCDYCLEIVAVGDTRLHYLFTYIKDNEFYTRDPGDGKEYKRSEITEEIPKYRFSNSGVFIKAK